MTISNLPPSPSRADDPAGFSSKMDALLGALPQLVIETNATAAAVDQDKADVALLKSQTEGVRTDAIVQTDAIRDDAILQTSSLRDTTLGYRNDAQAAAGSAAGYRDESQAYRDGAQAAAAAAGSAAGLPSLVGNARKALIVAPGEDAVAWGVSTQSGYQEFTSSGTWTKPAEATWVYVEAIGGGQSGGAGCGSTHGASQFGGAGGKFVSTIMRAVDVGASVTVTVGAGGVARSVTETSGQAGAAGGASSFGSHLVAPGGAAQSGFNDFGGGYECGYQTTPSNPGGSAVMGGAAGGNCGVEAATVGGASVRGGAGGAAARSTTNIVTTATSGTAPGGGGGAAAITVTASGVNATSGAGGNGRVRVWWW